MIITGQFEVFIFADETRSLFDIRIYIVRLPGELIQHIEGKYGWMEFKLRAVIRKNGVA